MLNYPISHRSRSSFGPFLSAGFGPLALVDLPPPTEDSASSTVVEVPRVV